MGGYAVLLVLHIISAVIWLSMIPADQVLRRYITSVSPNRTALSIWLKILNVSGIIGMTGLLVTGILLVVILPYYGFFVFANNHWLATKQVIMVALLLITGMYLIPLGKKVRVAIGSDLENNTPLAEEAVKTVKKLANLATLTGVLVTINFLLAITRRFLPQ